MYTYEYVAKKFYEKYREQLFADFYLEYLDSPKTLAQLREEFAIFLDSFNFGGQKISSFLRKITLSTKYLKAVAKDEKGLLLYLPIDNLKKSGLDWQRIINTLVDEYARKNAQIQNKIDEFKRKASQEFSNLTIDELNSTDRKIIIALMQKTDLPTYAFLSSFKINPDAYNRSLVKLIRKGVLFIREDWLERYVTKGYFFSFNLNPSLRNFELNPEVSKKFSDFLDEDFRIPLIPSKRAREVYFDLIEKNRDCFVFAEVPFPAIIDFERIKDRIGEYASYFWKARLDFVITDRNFIPIEAVEVQSPHHDYYQNRYRDEAKKFICKLAKIKLTIVK